jgi:hypothetical protein
MPLMVEMPHQFVEISICFPVMYLKGWQIYLPINWWRSKQD